MEETITARTTKRYNIYTYSIISSTLPAKATDWLSVLFFLDF